LLFFVLFCLFDFILLFLLLPPGTLAAKLVTLTKDSNRTKEPCGSCRGPKESLDKLTEFHPFRTVLEMKTLFEEAKTKTSKAESLKTCNTASLKFVEVWLVFCCFFFLFFCFFLFFFVLFSPPALSHSQLLLYLSPARINSGNTVTPTSPGCPTCFTTTTLG